jgi:cytochrome c oxidase assembly factor CtaG
MTEKKEKSKSSRLDLNSKFWKTFLVILAAFLTFAGPTYIVYVVFLKILNIDYVVSMFSGFALFIAGLLLIWYLIKRKVIS